MNLHIAAPALYELILDKDKKIEEPTQEIAQLFSSNEMLQTQLGTSLGIPLASDCDSPDEVGRKHPDGHAVVSGVRGCLFT